MNIFAGFCLLLSCVAGFVLGTRLLWMWWQRTRLVPELSIGLTALFLAISGAGLLALARVPNKEESWLYYASLLLLGLSSISLGFGLQQIFRPRERWSMLLCGFASAALLAWWALAVHLGGSGLAGEGGMRAALYNLSRLAIHVWATWECFHYHGMLKRRLALGLAKPMIVHRFWLWGISSACAVALLVVGMFASYVLHQSVMTWPVGLFALSGFGLVSSLTIWCAFFPPAFYGRWIEARGQRAGRSSDPASEASSEATRA